MVTMTDGIARAIRCVRHFRSLGLCPLPSKMDVKGPMLPTYAEHYGPTPVPESVYHNWATTNVQIITGTKSPTWHKIAVVDCDGPEALETWGRICLKNDYEPSGIWRARTGSGGSHFYFSLPPTLEACPSGLLWGLWDTWGDAGSGKWMKHVEIRLLADNALVVAPPSIHVDTGSPYVFAHGDDPRAARVPAEAPGWLLDLPRLTSPRFGDASLPAPARIPVVAPTGLRYPRERVLSAISDKVSLAKEWGLVFHRDQPNANGWAVCFVPGRENPRHSNPSGSFHVRDGTIQDRKDLSSMSLFDLGHLLQPGLFPRWQDCRDYCGDRFIGRL